MTIYIPTPQEAITLVNENKYKYHNIIKYHLRDFYNYLEQNYTGKTIAEKLYRYCYNPDIKCDNCGSPDVGFLEFTTGYKKYCSRICGGNSEANKIGRERYLSDPTKVRAQLEKSKETSIRKYGKTHWGKTEAGKILLSQKCGQPIREKFRKEREGQTRKQYTAAARHLTNVYYKEFTDKIDPSGLRSREWVIDHIFSIYDGYMNGVPLEVICHWTNLQIIHKTQNSSKNCRSDKTLDELYEDYRLAQAEPVSSIPLPCSK